MTKLEWGNNNRYINGVDRGVLYFKDHAVSWPGLISVEESNSDSEVTSLYFDGIKYLNITNSQDVSFKVESFIYPDELDDNANFGFSYRSKLGDSYQLHFVYQVTALPGELTYNSLGGSQDLENLSFEFSTTPILVPNAKSSAHLILDTSVLYPYTLDLLETVMYGDQNNKPRFPTPNELVELLKENVSFIVVDHGDGSWTAIGSEEMVTQDSDSSFVINSPSAIVQDAVTYSIETI